jgi:hypothetical protein
MIDAAESAAEVPMIVPNAVSGALIRGGEKVEEWQNARMERLNAILNGE